MTDSDIKPLLQVSDKIIAEEIKRILEESGIYCLLQSDNPASSFINTYMGSATKDDITIQINELDHTKALKVIKDNGYQDLLLK